MHRELAPVGAVDAQLVGTAAHNVVGRFCTWLDWLESLGVQSFRRTYTECRA